MTLIQAYRLYRVERDGKFMNLEGSGRGPSENRISEFNWNN